VGTITTFRISTPNSMMSKPKEREHAHIRICIRTRHLHVQTLIYVYVSGSASPHHTDLVLMQRNYLSVTFQFFQRTSLQNFASHAMTDTMTDMTDTPQPCVSHTYTSPAIIQLLKSLSLPNILQKNKKIEAENDARSTKTLNNALDWWVIPNWDLKLLH